MKAFTNTATAFSTMNDKVRFEVVPYTKDEVNQSISSRFAKIVAKHHYKTAICSNRYLWTYNDLNRFSNRIAKELLSLYPQSQVFVGLLLGHDAPMIAAMFGALKAAAVYVPLDPAYPKDRLAYMLKDSNIRVIITDDQYLDLALSLATTDIHIVNFNKLNFTDGADHPDSNISPDTLVYVLYTSGSTGTPKGVIQNHRNILHHIRVWTHALDITPTDKMTLLSSFSWDSAVQDTYGALLNGAASYPFAIKDENFESLVDFVLDHGLTICHATVPVYRYFINTLKPRNRVPGLRVMALGAGMIYQRDIDNYKTLFADDCIIVNAYGSTETTTAIIYSIDKNTSIPCYPIPIGYPVFETDVLLLDESGKEIDVNIDDTGEIAICSEYVALGYLNKPELTATKFKDSAIIPGKRIYYTGDIGSLLEDGCLRLSGRRDDQIKIRGFRVEPGEIAAALIEHANIREAEVMAFDHPSGNKRLVAYIVSNNGDELSPGELRRFLAASLPDYMLPATFIQLEALPLTPNKKIDRNALPRPNWTRRSLDQIFVEPRNPLETTLSKLWAEVLGIDLVGIEDNFFELGGDSLLGIQLVMLAAKIGVKFNYSQLFQYPTISELATLVEETEPTATDSFQNIRPMAANQPMVYLEPKQIEQLGVTSELIEDIWPLSPTQEGIYFESLMAGSDKGPYSEQFYCTLQGHLDIPAFERAWQILIQRHSVLRSGFTRKGLSKPLQLIHKHIPFKLSTLDYSEMPGEEKHRRLLSYQQNQIKLGFKLSEPPLMRVTLIKQANEEYHLIWTYHHIMLDGWSETILLEELFSLIDSFVRQKPLQPSLEYSYRYYLEWLQQQDIKTAESFWRNKLKNFKYPNKLTFGKSVGSDAANIRVNAVKKMELPIEKPQSVSRQYGLTLSTFIQGIWSLILSHISGDQDIIYGAITSGRGVDLPEIENMVGLLINILPMRVKVEPQAPFISWLHNIQIDLAELHQFEYIPFSQIQKWSDFPNPNTPLISSIFSFLNFPATSNVQDEATDIRVVDRQFFSSSHYPITLFVDPSSNLLFKLVYNRYLFDSDHIDQIFQHFKILINSVIENPARSVGDYMALLKR